MSDDIPHLPDDAIREPKSAHPSPSDGLRAMTTKLSESEEPPVHDCPIQGPNTKYVRTLNIEIGKRGWACVWCEMAKKMKGQK